MCVWFCSVSSFQTRQSSIPQSPMDQASGGSLTYSSWSCHHWLPAVICRTSFSLCCALKCPMENLNCGGSKGILAKPTPRLMALGPLHHISVDLLASWYPPLCVELAVKSDKMKVENASPQRTGTKTPPAGPPKSQLIFKISPRVPCNPRTI